MKVINRVKASNDFAKVIKTGKACRTNSFTIHFLKTDTQYTRVGVSVSNKIGNAVVRNRLKRQIRAMSDELIKYDLNSFDIIIIARKEILNFSFQENKLQLSNLLYTQVGLLNEK